MVKRRINICEDITRYQDVLDKASSKVDFSVGEGIYMMPSDMNLTISDKVAGYNNKVLISRKGFGVGKNKLINNNTNNLINIHKTVAPNKQTIAASVTNEKPATATPETVTTPVLETSDKITNEEEIVAVGVTPSLIAAVWVIYK